MSGKVLIVDGLATNRIVMKVKLSAAYYDVIQADTAAEAMALAIQESPDLVICAPVLADMTGPEFVRRLKTRQGSDAPPVLLFLCDPAPGQRLDALHAGADEVLVKPVADPALLARLRSLLRQHQVARDLRMHAGAVSALGLSEAARGFDRPGRIGLIVPDRGGPVGLAQRLAQCSGHKVTPLDPETALAAPRSDVAPELYVLRVCARSRDAATDLIANLNAKPHSRSRPILVLLAADAQEQMANLLDMGVADVIAEASDPDELVLRVGRHLGFARRAEAMREQLQSGLRAAVVDPLTGLYNRRYALPFLNRLIDSAPKEGRGFAVMVADLDHFKLINDRHGHAAGDTVLRNVARLLKSNLRQEDMIARIGGEEFMIVMPETTRGEARRVARQLCAAVRDTPVPVASSEAPVHVTVSIGVTIGHAGGNATELLDEADRALYGSKSGGRNTVTFCRHPAA